MLVHSNDSFSIMRLYLHRHADPVTSSNSVNLKPPFLVQDSGDRKSAVASDGNGPVSLPTHKEIGVTTYRKIQSISHLKMPFTSNTKGSVDGF